MKVSVMSTVEHDKIMSITSHLSLHLIAFTIEGIILLEKMNLLIFQPEDLKISLQNRFSDPKRGRIFLLKIKNI